MAAPHPPAPRHQVLAHVALDGEDADGRLVGHAAECYGRRDVGPPAPAPDLE